MREFLSADDRQRELRDAILVPHFYERLFAGKYRFLDNHPLQFKGVDTAVVHRGCLLCIEEKIVNWPALKGKPHTAFTLETWSCTVEGREKTGWMEYSIADFLLYCFAVPETETALDCYLIDFPALKAWFWPRVEMFNVTRSTQINRTECRVVDITDVLAAVPTRHHQLGDCFLWKAAA